MEDTCIPTGREESVRKPVSEEITDKVGLVEILAKDVAVLVASKLNPVLRVTPSFIYGTNSVVHGVDSTVAYPPLFAELSEKLTAIEHALNDIQSTMSRVEL